MKPLVLCVHQIGKVGSTTVVGALSRRFPSRQVYQTHALSTAGVLNGLSWWLGCPDSPRGKFPDHLSGSIDLRRRFGGRFGAARWFIFCLVRNPFDRDVSAFFQNLEVYWVHRIPAKTRAICELVLAGHEVGDADLDELVDDLANVFISEFPPGLFDRWFDHEMREAFGIDVFAEPFDHERGYGLYDHSSSRAVVIRLEDMPRAFDPAAQALFAGSELETEAGGPLCLDESRANDGGTKSYSAIYRRFVARISASPEASVRVGSSRVSSHFYSQR